MMKKIILLNVFAFVCLASQAQITITSSHMPSAGMSFLYSNAKLSSLGDYTTTGTNHAWHFDTLVPISQGLREFKSGVNTPYSVIFGLTAFGEKTIDTVPLPTIPVPGLPTINITDLYSFYKNTSSKYTVEGMGVKINNIPVPNFYSDDEELYFFPLSYGNPKDSSTFRFSTITTTLIPFVYIKQGYRITQVDGWGTITTPYGTENCLRLVTTQHSIDTLKGIITLPIVGTVPFNVGFPNVVRSYQWLTLSEKIPYLEVSGNVSNNGNFNPNQIRYRDITRPVGIQEYNNQPLVTTVFPNPTSDILTIVTKSTTEPINVEIFDLESRLVKTISVKSNQKNESNVDLSSLTKGLYLLKLSNSQSTQTLKISVQ